MMEKLFGGQPWFTGLGSQANSFAAGDAKGDTVFVARKKRNSDGYLYSSFSTMEAFMAFYLDCAPEERSFYAIDRSQSKDGYTSSFYLDVEWIVAGKDPFVKQRLLKIKSAIKGALPGIKDFDIKNKVFTRKRPDGTCKYSYHFYVPCAVFKDNAEVGEFVKEKLWHDQALISDELMMCETANKPIIDFAVYTKNRVFRLPGSAKEPGGELPNNMPASKTELLDYFTGWMRPVTHRLKKEKKLKRQTMQPLTVGHDAQVCGQIEAMLREVGDMHTTVRPGPQGQANYVGITNRQHGRKCFVSGEHNQSDCCFFNVTRKGKVWYHCYDQSAHAFCACKLLGTLPGWSEPGRDEEGIDISGDDLWLPAVKIITHPEKEGYISKISFFSSGKRRCKIIGAHCGRGKSYAVGRMIKAMERDDPNLRVLAISARVSHSATQREQLPGFAHYKDPNFHEARKIITQYESLHLLRDAEVAAFGVIILDEARSICGQMMSVETNGRFIGQNAAYLRTLMSFKEAKIVAMDADVETDGVVATLLQKVCRPDEITLHRYPNNPTKRTFYATRDRAKVKQKVTGKIRAGEKSAIACATKAAAKDWEQLLIKDRPDLKVVTIHGDSDDSLKTGMQLPDLLLSEFDVLIFTSAVSIGCDVQLPWDHVFVDASSRNGCVPRVLLQMVGRFRRLKTDRIDLICPPKPTSSVKNLPLRYRLKAAQQDLRDREGDLEKYKGMIRFVQTFGDDGTLTLAPDWMTQMHIHDRAERMAMFEVEFKRQAARHQFPIIYDAKEEAESAETKAEFKQLRELSKEAEEELTKTAFCDMNEISAEELRRRIDDLDGRVKKQKASEHEKIECGVSHTLKHFRGGGPEKQDDEERQEKRGELSYDSFKKAHTKKRAMFNIAMVKKKGPGAEEVIMPLRNKLRDSEFANLPTAALPYMSALCTIQALDLLGIKDAGLRDEDEGKATFSKAELVAKRNEIIELTNTAARVSGKRVRVQIKSEKVAKDPAHEPLTGLKRAVESSFGARIEGVRSRKRTGGHKLNITDRYTLSHDKELIELAMISNAFEGDCSAADEQSNDRRPKTEHSIGPPRKRQRPDVPDDQSQLSWGPNGLDLLI